MGTFIRIGGYVMKIMIPLRDGANVKVPGMTFIRD
jgi:hypothetical protein